LCKNVTLAQLLEFKPGRVVCGDSGKREALDLRVQGIGPSSKPSSLHAKHVLHAATLITTMTDLRNLVKPCLQVRRAGFARDHVDVLNC